MPSARLPKRTRLIVDRLARRAHAFHRFAHHPLCERYAGELIPLGRKTRLCRGCCYAVLGTMCGTASAVLARPSFGALVFSAVLGLGLLATSLVVRPPKWLGRALACAAVSFAAIGGLCSGQLLARAVSLALVVVGGLFLWGYRQRGPNRGPCQTCPERLAPTVCSGLRPIVRRERAFRRVAQRLIDQAVLSRS
ncbi:MAG TPA: hypothetical protein VK745_05335 [Polyangiaceae bacterium]|jgi:hypothetical protein|nr:hypothetical protein [Polyangiaceae bacterium]